MLLVSTPSPAANTLEMGEENSIQLTIRVQDCSTSGPFNNQATASGIAPPDNTVVTDNSVNGTDPDPDGDGSPMEEFTTPVSFTETSYLGLAKRLVGSPVLNSNGTYQVTYEFRVVNRGNTVIESVQITDDLSAVFSSNCTYQVDQITSSQLLVNTAFSGTGAQTGLLTAGNTLAPYSQASVFLTLTVGPCTTLGTFSNTATVHGTAG